MMTPQEKIDQHWRTVGQRIKAYYREGDFSSEAERAQAYRELAYFYRWMHRQNTDGLESDWTPRLTQRYLHWLSQIGVHRLHPTRRADLAQTVFLKFTRWTAQDKPFKNGAPL